MSYPDVISCASWTHPTAGTAMIWTTKIATNIQMIIDCRPAIFIYSQAHAEPVIDPNTDQKPSQSAYPMFISPLRK